MSLVYQEKIVGDELIRTRRSVKSELRTGIQKPITFLPRRGIPQLFYEPQKQFLGVLLHHYTKCHVHVLMQ